MSGKVQFVVDPKPGRLANRSYRVKLVALESPSPLELAWGLYVSVPSSPIREIREKEKPL